MPLIMIKNGKFGPATGKYFFADADRQDQKRRYIVPGEAAYVPKSMCDFFDKDENVDVISLSVINELNIKVVNKEIRERETTNIKPQRDDAE